MRMVRVMAIAALLAGTAPALSQSWPTRPMTLVVPFAAGGTSDVIARLLAEGLRAQLGQPVLVENVGGAGGMTLQYGSAGIGGSNHLACALLNSALGINITHVPYRSGAQAMQDMLAGRIDYQCPSAPVALPQIDAGTVKAFAILSRNRSASMPSLPSAHEQGLTDFDIPTWYALFLPVGTPKSIVRQLNQATVATLANPTVQQRLKEIGSDLVPPERMTPDYLGTFIAAEIEKWAKTIKANGISLE